MNGRALTLSPVSVEGSDWSAISGYKSLNTNSSYSPYTSTPSSTNFTSPTSVPGYGSSSNGTSRMAIDTPSNPSPPSSVARSSDGNTLYGNSDSMSIHKQMLVEEALAGHYVALRRYLAPTLNLEQGNTRPNRARDKLLRLSSVQFQELSTDVYDELLRRQQGQRKSQPEPPPYLLPKDIFHPKRNQARQKLSTLPPLRFRDLATDVFYELERRFPGFSSGDIDRAGSPASSIRSAASRVGPMNGPGSRQNGVQNNNPYTRQNGLGVPGEGGGDYGRPLPKTFQSNTIVPSKSTLVEDDGVSPDEEYNNDTFSRESKYTNRSLGGPENNKAVLELREKVEELENQLRKKDDELETFQNSERDLRVKLRDKEMELGRLRDSERDARNKLMDKDAELSKLANVKSATNLKQTQWDSHRSELERTLEEARNRNASLESELEDTKSSISQMERDLRSQLDYAKRGALTGSEQWKDRFEDLQQDYEKLRVELKEQQYVTDEVKREASEFLREMKLLSQDGNQDWGREEKLAAQISSLEKEVRDWRDRYAKTKTQLRNLRASSIGLSIQQPNATQITRDAGFTHSDGLVKDVHVTKFQIAIDELLRTARVGEPSSVLDFMKTVVLSVRNITRDIDDTSPAETELCQQQSKLKSRVSATANNLITASKNFSSSNGISPVSLLDAAASHLTTAVVELIRTVKIRPTPAGELEDDDDGTLPPGDSPVFFPVPNERVSSDHTGLFPMQNLRSSGSSTGLYPVQNGRTSGASSYSSISSPTRGHFRAKSSVSKETWVGRRPLSRTGVQSSVQNGVGRASQKTTFAIRASPTEVEDLKIFIENQTERLVDSIQSLVSSIRSDSELTTIQKYINEIASDVGKVVNETSTTLGNLDNSPLGDHTMPILRKLSDGKSRLLDASAESMQIGDAFQLREFTNRLPPLAFEIVRQTKALIQSLDGLDDMNQKGGN